MKKSIVCLFLLIPVICTWADATDDLWKALKALDVNGVETALAAGTDVNKPDATFGVPLNYAAAFADANILGAILKAKPNLEAEHPANKFTPIFSAVTWGNTTAVKLLIDAGASINKPLQVGNLLTTAFATGNGSIIKMILDKGMDVKKNYQTIGAEWPPVIFFVMFFKNASERMEFIEQMKPVLAGMGINSLPEFMVNPPIESFITPQEALAMLKTAGMDINGVQSVPGTKVKKSALAMAFELDKTEIADALIAVGADKGGPGVKEAMAIAKANSKPNAFTEATSNPSKIKVAFDFPREGRNSNGGGYSANLSLLPNKPTRVALISYYVYDPGSGKVQGSNFAGSATTTAWRTTDFVGQSQADGFYSKSIDAMKDAFKANGITLLTPDEFLDTEEKKQSYYEFNQESAKREKTDAVMLGKMGTIVDISTLKVTPRGKGYRPFFVANERMDKSDIALFQGGVFSANRKLTSSLGYELCSQLGVDAVLVTYIATRKEKMYGGGYGVNAVMTVMLGPNPGKSDESDPEAKNLGQFYCGTRTYFSDPIEFQGEKTKPQYDGMANILAAHANKMSGYIKGKEKD
jgi:hypothetical protein